MFKSILGVIAVAFVLSLVVHAQPGKYNPGDKIDYMDYGKWVGGGTFVGETPGGKQPIIRKAPNEFYPEGSQTAWDWEKIRPAAQPKPQPKNDPPPRNEPPPPNPREDNPGPGGNVDNKCGGQMTQDQVYNFLHGKLGNNPFNDPAKKERTEREAAKMIRDCGLTFRFDTDNAFRLKLGNYGITSIVNFPLQANFGPPNKRNSLFGTWTVGVQSLESILVIDARNGSLTINANGSYIWKESVRDPQNKWFRGTWRAATDQEMIDVYQGGEGVVLLDARAHEDWLVRPDRRTPLGGRWITIAVVGHDSQRNYGFQK